MVSALGALRRTGGEQFICMKVGNEVSITLSDNPIEAKYEHLCRSSRELSDSHV